MDVKTLKILEDKANEVCAHHGVKLHSIDFIKEEANNYTLLLLLSKDGGIEIDDCANVSEEYSKILDQLDLIEQEYVLEVASKSSEEELNSLEDYKNHLEDYILIQVKERVLDYDELVGYLKEVKDDSIVLEIMIKARKKLVEIKLNNIDFAKTTFKF